MSNISPLNAQLNPICHLLALLGAHHILHVSRIGVKPKNRLSLIDKCKKFCRVSRLPWMTSQSPKSLVSGPPLVGLNRPDRRDNHFLAFSVEFKNTRSYSSTTPYPNQQGYYFPLDTDLKNTRYWNYFHYLY
jgi:hypothetical protein